MNLLARFFRKPASARDDAIANTALDLSLEWGPNFGKPIQDRLLKKFPTITRARADELDQFCKEVKKFAFDLYYDQVMPGKMRQDAAQAKIKQRYPFLNRANLSRLDTQGMYYAHK
ncbi:MAG: hypothetical protein HZC40_17380 [Chloroflexi bacterium]|nr:hypothetical protein [Chloroflexota bacterium]